MGFDNSVSIILTSGNAGCTNFADLSVEGVDPLGCLGSRSPIYVRKPTQRTHNADVTATLKDALALDLIVLFEKVQEPWLCQLFSLVSPTTDHIQFNWAPTKACNEAFR
jgi:hypothetical protein